MEIFIRQKFRVQKSLNYITKIHRKKMTKKITSTSQETISGGRFYRRNTTFLRLSPLQVSKLCGTGGLQDSDSGQSQHRVTWLSLRRAPPVAREASLGQRRGQHQAACHPRLPGGSRPRGTG